MKRALGERCHYYILNILSDNWQNDGFRQLKAEMAHTPIQFVIHLNLASTCDENEGKGTSVHRLKHCHFNQVMRTLKSCNDKETCQKVCCTFRVFVSLFFFVPVVVIVALSSLAGSPRKNILDMHRFSRKTKDFVENGRPKSTSTSSQVQKLKFIFRPPYKKGDI